MSMILNSSIPFFAKVPVSNDRWTSIRPQTATPATRPSPDQPRGSFGIRQIQRNKAALRDIALGIIRTTRPNVKPSGIGRSAAHTVWISGNKLYAVTGFHTEAFDIDELSITTSGFMTSVSLNSPDGHSITIKPYGSAWRTFFEHLNAVHPNVTISRRVWALTSRSNDTYEYFER